MILLPSRDEGRSVAGSTRPGKRGMWKRTGRVMGGGGAKRVAAEGGTGDW